MAFYNSINLLPETFRSQTNIRFLGATLDQLITDSANVPIDGYIGRRFAPTYQLGDNYNPEPTKQRQDYQLEPGIVIKDNQANVLLNSTYVDLLNALSKEGGINSNQERLFSDTFYTFDGHFDFDKFVNYNNYYWLPNGPAAVTVSSGTTPLLADYTVTRNTSLGGYTFSGVTGHADPQITLSRGGTYSFTVNQPGFPFWIQTESGTSGVDATVPTVSTREILGVTNNGTDVGVITFTVPQSSAQDFYTQMSLATTVDAAADFGYTDIQNQLLSQFLTKFPNGIDGLTSNLQSKTFIFISNQTDNLQWTTPAIPTGFSGTDTNQFAPGSVVNSNLRTNTWSINLIPSGADYLIQVHPVTTVNTVEKVFISSGLTYAARQFWLDQTYSYRIVPPTTAPLNYLYYQDGVTSGYFGEIKIVDNATVPINVTRDILGQTGYTSPNGVTFTNGLKIQFDSLVVPTTYAGNEYYVEGVGQAITLTPVNQLVVTDGVLNQIQSSADYITINRSSQDQNPWSRSNRWFHVDIINATANYNNTVADYGPNISGRRPIIEFVPNLQLFNYGAQAKNNVDLLTFDSTDAFVDIEGQQSYILDGALLTPGMRIIFANDIDPNVKNEIWQVDIQIINSTNFLRLITTTDDPVVAGQNILVTQGINSGKVYRFDGTNWFECQEKTSLNQPPLFDLVDRNGYSFADTTVYPSTTFAGSQLFGYSVGAGTADTIIGFPLSYQNFNNIGDIVFNNYYSTDTFTYISSGVTVSEQCSSGYIKQNASLTSNSLLTDWIDSVENSKQYQIVTVFYEGYQVSINNTNYAFVQIDVLPNVQSTVPTLKVFQNNQLLEPTVDYQIVSYGVYDLITFNFVPAVGDKIDVLIDSSSTSQLGYYEIPQNLEYNPLNSNFASITSGQIRSHYNKLIENTSYAGVTTANRDRYLNAQGGTILRQKSPVPYSMLFTTDPIANFFEGNYLARKEYQRFKNKFLQTAITLNGLNYNDPVTAVDTILKTINSVKNNSFSWYYSDMIPQGDGYNTIVYTVLNPRQNRYEISEIFSTSQLTGRATLVYLNGVQLLSDNIDFYFNQVSPEIVVNIPLNVGDVITIREYSSTDGNYIPETPTKLGLYGDYIPAIYTDTTYLTPIEVVRGHDGSITPAFGDFRDQLLLELEKRIYNNLKISYRDQNLMNRYNTVPGKFRATDYSLNEWVQLTSKNFLQWVGSNGVDYTTNSWFESNNPWTWNYATSADAIDGSPLQGSWRAIYNYWFDTDRPHIAPWEMLGFSQQPVWWIQRYGPAPYTGSNTVLWSDLEAGYIWNNGAPYTDSRFARPGLANFIPVDSAGNLLDPVSAKIVKSLDTLGLASNFQVGQQGPAETAWKNSSDYPYAVCQALALARPAEFFSTQIDLSRFASNATTGQFTDVNNNHLAPSLLAVNGDTISIPGSIQRTSGYINWISDYIKNLGIDPVSKLKLYFSKLNVQLSYRVAGFTDSKLLTVFAEQTSPGSTNASVVIPTDNIDVYIGTPVPNQTLVYSAVVVTKTTEGYSVSGYDITNPFFTIIPSVANNNANTVTVDQLSVKLYQTSAESTANIPYGTTYNSYQQLTDFLISYERYLTKQGFVFNDFDSDLQATRDWTLSIREFLYWTQQNWAVGSLIVLNPIANRLFLNVNGSVVGKIDNRPNSSKLLDTNFQVIKNNDFNIVRTDTIVAPYYNQTLITTVNPAISIAYAKLYLEQYETTLIFDNQDDFGDILYIPEQGTRQYRLRLSGHKTGLWDGALSAAGYVYSDPQIRDWQSNTDYKQGDLVYYNNAYYTATQDISASNTFNVGYWTRIDQSSIQTGLLPSFAHNAQIFNRIYDVDSPPSDKNLQTFSSGLIGFRERPFLSNLGISTGTQTKFYQGYIKQKGTEAAISALTKATFNVIKSNISVYEEWAFRSGVYGSVNSNQYTEFVLDQSVFTNDPVAFTVTDNYSTANLVVNLALTGNTLTSNVYNASNVYSTNTALYDNRTEYIYSTDLPTAGYVNLNDIDHQVFDITTLTTVANLSIADKIWVAKDFNSTWNVLRVTGTGLTANLITYNLDNYATITFNNTHSFVSGDHFVLKDFSVYYDSIYTIVTVPNVNSVVVAISNVTALINSVGSVTGAGNVYTLNSQVVNTDANIGSATPYGGWLTGDRQWVNVDTAAGATGWAVYEYNALTFTWSRTRQQEPRVDITTVGRTFLFDKTDNVILSVLDIYDPNKAKVLSIAGNEIDYLSVFDPAVYNQGNLQISAGYHWGPQQVGKIWWNLDSIRYIDYEQSDIIYRLAHWGEQFPGSSIQVYEWVESPVPPSQYAAVVGNGVPLYTNDAAYSTYGYSGATGTFNYYFWVTGKTSVAPIKNSSVYAIAGILSNPQAQGIPYATVLSNNTLALFNVKQQLTGTNTIVQLGKASNNSGVIHSEYTLVQENNPESIIPANIENKLIDSLSGQDSAGNPVPDPALPISQAYGISIRPRQSMFINRSLALSNYITFVNAVLSSYPTTERKLMTLLNSEEPVPNPLFNLYNRVVNTYSELPYIDTTAIATGYNILVLDDSTQNSRWSIYTWNTPVAGQWNLTRVQSYKTNLYWNYADWYETGYDYTVLPDLTVADKLEFGKLTLTPNTYVKILNNGNNQFVVYYIDANLFRTLVGVQNGTVQISTGAIPALELRQILLAVQTQLFVDDLAIDYNQLFFLMIKYALSEQKNIDWAFKTSFISATQNIRQLYQYPAYIADNQSYYQDYINEVKPYRSVIREFIVDYQGTDQYSGDATDFDLQPYWDTNLQIYRSPNGEQSYDANLFASTTYLEWANNYQYKVVDIQIENPGTGFIFPPDVIVSGGGGSGVVATAAIDGLGRLASITISNPGSGFTSIPSVILNGTGSGAVLKPILRQVYDGGNTGHNLIRSIKSTIKFDRINYTNSNVFVAWASLTSADAGNVIPAGTIIKLDNQLYTLSNSYVIDANITWPGAGNVTAINYSSFDNANDRIIASQGNIDLTLTQPGLSYGGVIVDANTFVGNVFDTTIQSFYSNVFGVNPNDLTVDGGAYVSRYSSYAPEELVPGRMFDTLDFMVFDTNQLSFRIFDNYTGNLDFRRIATANITSLTANLNLTDTSIAVTDAARLPLPDPAQNQPGVIYINGEKIVYWRNYALETPTVWAANLLVPANTLLSYTSNLYITTGNVFDLGGTFANVSSNVVSVQANTLAQIRRAVDMTSPADVHLAGSLVIDAGQQQLIPNSYTYTGYTTTNLYTTTDTVSYVLSTTANISANINDQLTQISTVPNWQANYASLIGSYVFYSGNTYTVTGNVYGTNFTDSSVQANVAYAFAGNTYTSAELRVLDSITNNSNVVVQLLSGNIQGLPDEYDNPLGFDIAEFDNVAGAIYVNGVPTTAYAVRLSVLGLVNGIGQASVPVNTKVQQSNVWYSPGAGTITNGLGLSNSTTEQANFLKSSPGITPTPGTLT